MLFVLASQVDLWLCCVYLHHCWTSYLHCLLPLMFLQNTNEICTLQATSGLMIRDYTLEFKRSCPWTNTDWSNHFSLMHHLPQSPSDWSATYPNHLQTEMLPTPSGFRLKCCLHWLASDWSATCTIWLQTEELPSLFWHRLKQYAWNSLTDCSAMCTILPYFGATYTVWHWCNTEPFIGTTFSLILVQHIQSDTDVTRSLLLVQQSVSYWCSVVFYTAFKRCCSALVQTFRFVLFEHSVLH